MEEDQVTKVAVLGGGPAGLAAAWHLANADPTLDITVYQQGWRLGGKGASSRGPAGRIEEHGIHLFGNFYGNALRMLRQAYAETGRSLDQELLPNNLHLSLHETSNRRFSLRVAEAEIESSARGDDNIHPDLLGRKLREAMVEAIVGMAEIPSARPTTRNKLTAWCRRSLANALTANVVSNRTAQRLQAFAPTAGVPEEDAEEYARATAEVMKYRPLVRVARWLSWMSPRAEIRHIQTDLLFTSLYGAIKDRVFVDGIDTIDHRDHLNWLRSHGASEKTLSSVVSRTVANICFQYPAGNSNGAPSMSAAAFLTFILRQLAAPGPNFWYFRRGTGESVVLPLHEALAHPPQDSGRRPVRFEFFTRITDVVPGVDDNGTPIISSIDLRRHARPLNDEYDPIAEAAGLRYWPSSPILERLDPEDASAIKGLDLENWYQLFAEEPGYSEKLIHGVDFDTVVLAIPPPAHAWTCPSLLRSEPWREMVDGLEFIPTQGVQLWIEDSGEDLGLPQRPYRLGPERWSTAEWHNPYSCWVDYSDLVAEEHWEPRRPRSLLYFCGPLSIDDGSMPDPTDPTNAGYPDAAARAVMAQATQMLSRIGQLLPGSIDGGTFRYDRLVAAGDGDMSQGPARLATQYLRANVLPTERYGLSRPGHLAHRRSAWESGYDNLTLAGDWTFTGLNINSFEGATMSGALASYALTGVPDARDIIGYDFLRPDGGPRRPQD